MADKYDCAVCDELSARAPEFVVNGVTDEICSDLQEDNGLSGESTNCEDLTNANDCLIGSLAEEIEKYDACDWKPYMRKFAPNVHEMLHAMICSECGIWSNIHNIWAKINEILADLGNVWTNINNLWTKTSDIEGDVTNAMAGITGLDTRVTHLETESSRLDCVIDYMSHGTTFEMGETPATSEKTSGSYLVAGKGVSYLIPHTTYSSSDIAISYVAGGLGIFSGSFQWFTQDFTDEASMLNYDTNAVAPRNSKSRKGNPIWGTNPPAMVTGGELVCEMRIDKREYPQLRNLWGGFGQETGSGSFHVRAAVFTEGTYAFGQHGQCKADGSPWATGYDSGHLVPANYVYVQIRITSLFAPMTNDAQYSPRAFMGVRMNADEITC